jgi:uncharacterized SAM-binding protein YcdF (DUF218 family)
VSWAIVVPGSGRTDRDGSYRIGPRATACVRAAARLAEVRRPRAVVFTGWSPVPGGPSEADQMRAVWDGPDDVELLVETTATITAENMSRTLPLLVERGVREVTVVCGALHLPRVRFYFGGVYPRHGIRCAYVRTRQLPTPTALTRELVAVALMRGQRRRALAELAGLHVARQIEPNAVGDAPGRQVAERA